MVVRPTREKPKRSYHHGNLRAALLETAVDVIEEHGVGEVRLRDLARRVGVSHGAPANHFKDRNDLLIAIAVEGCERLTAKHEEVLAREHACPADALNALGVAYVEFAVENRAHFEVMFQRDLLRTPALLEAGARSFEVLLGAVESVMAAHAPTGGTSKKARSDARLVALGCWATAHGLATLHVQGLLPWVSDANAPRLAEQVIAAMTRVGAERATGAR